MPPVFRAGHLPGTEGVCTRTCACAGIVLGHRQEAADGLQDGRPRGTIWTTARELGGRDPDTAPGASHYLRQKYREPHLPCGWIRMGPEFGQNRGGYLACTWGVKCGDWKTGWDRNWNCSKE